MAVEAKVERVKDELAKVMAKVMEETVETPPCAYREWSTEIGDMVQCGLDEHGPRTRHGAWRTVG